MQFAQSCLMTSVPFECFYELKLIFSQASCFWTRKWHLEFAAESRNDHSLKPSPGSHVAFWTLVKLRKGFHRREKNNRANLFLQLKSRSDRNRSNFLDHVASPSLLLITFVCQQRLTFPGTSLHLWHDSWIRIMLQRQRWMFRFSRKQSLFTTVNHICKGEEAPFTLDPWNQGTLF